VSGAFEFRVPAVNEKNPRFITAYAEGYLPAGVVVASANVEIEFILVPLQSK
jgi:hypothetical protein